jgi:hypothetical protein
MFKNVKYWHGIVFEILHSPSVGQTVDAIARLRQSDVIRHARF